MLSFSVNDSYTFLKYDNYTTLSCYAAAFMLIRINKCVKNEKFVQHRSVECVAENVEEK